MGSKEENECHIKSIITIGFNNKKKTLFVKITPSVLKKKRKKISCILQRNVLARFITKLLPEAGRITLCKL